MTTVAAAWEKKPRPSSGDAPVFAVPGLAFDNRSPFAAIAFDMVDQLDMAYHVIVAKTAYTIGPCDGNGWAELTALTVPAQLNTTDRHERDDPVAGIVEESDFAPYKPRCDVIVNGCAHAPAGKSVRRFDVRLLVQAAQGATLIDKVLSVCGQRWFRKKAALRRLLAWPLKILTLGSFRPNAWTLSSPSTLTQLPLRYDYASGGAYRIEADGKGRPETLEACEENPLGMGFARPRFLTVARPKAVPAPQIGAGPTACSATQFQRGIEGASLPEPAGFGVIGRAWKSRLALAGHIETKSDWGADELPRLPADFDFAYWNCAPPDQQCGFLDGGEQLTLVNLCRPESSAARVDADGNALLRFVLPRQALFVLLATRDDKFNVLKLAIDTVYIDPEAGRIDLVWRGCLEADGEHVEARLLHASKPAQLARLQLLLQRQRDAQGAPAASAPSAPSVPSTPTAR